jgi:hypothetical protein
MHRSTGIEWSGSTEGWLPRKRNPMPAAPGRSGRRHPNGVDRQSRPPAHDEWEIVPGAPSGLPRSHQITEAGVVLPCNHGMGDKHMEFVIDRLQAFLDGVR